MALVFWVGVFLLPLQLVINVNTNIGLYSHNNQQKTAQRHTTNLSDIQTQQWWVPKD